MNVVSYTRFVFVSLLLGLCFLLKTNTDCISKQLEFGLSSVTMEEVDKMLVIFRSVFVMATWILNRQ